MFGLAQWFQPDGPLSWLQQSNNMVCGLLMTLSRALLSCVFLVAAGPLLAHHSFTMFDMTKKMTLVGTVTTFEWTNPHSYIEIDVPDEQGAIKHWSIEMGSPSILQQSGWKFSSLKKGDKTTLIISPLKKDRKSVV